jgi:hypothetical protein
LENTNFKFLVVARDPGESLEQANRRLFLELVKAREKIAALERMVRAKQIPLVAEVL